MNQTLGELTPTGLFVELSPTSGARAFQPSRGQRPNVSNLALLRERPGAQLIPGRFELSCDAEPKSQKVNAKKAQGPTHESVWFLFDTGD